MNKGSTPSYTVTFEIKVPNFEKPLLDRKLEAGKAVYNTALGYFLKCLRTLQGMPEWRACCSEIKRLTRQKKKTAETKKRLSFLCQEQKRIEISVGYSINQGEAYISRAQKHFKPLIGSWEAQKSAKRAFLAVERIKNGKAKRVRFKKRGDPFTQSNKGHSGLRLDGTKVIWGKQKFDLIVDKKDSYAQDTFQDRTKYIEITKKRIRSRERYFITAVKEGVPPAKKRRYGPNSSVGIDASPSTAVVYSENGVILEELAPGAQNPEREIKLLQREIDRSIRQNNPSCFDPKTGVFIKGTKIVNITNRCRKLKNKLKDLYRKQAAIRKQSHEKLANKILEIGTEVKVEDSKISSWAKRSKKTRKNKKNGKTRTKKRYGKAVANRAPGMLLEIIDRKLSYIGKGLIRVNTRKVRASQYDHATGQFRKKKICERWGMIDGFRVQRDLYSAFLISNVDGKGWEKINREKCREGWNRYKENQEKALAKANKKLGIF